MGRIIERMDALFVSADGFLLTHSEQIVTLPSWTAMPVCTENLIRCAESQARQYW
jgi:hypothetical protein